MTELGEGEAFSILCYNSVDSESVPENFRYVTSPVYPNNITDLTPRQSPHSKLL